MSILVRELLKDYGSECASIGEYLNIKNSSSIPQIQKNTKLDDFHVQLGLSVLIQRRIVSYVVYGKETFYKLDSEMVLRRLFFNLYVRYVYDRFESHRTFLKILVCGTFKIDGCKENIEPMLQQGILKALSLKDLRYGHDNGGNTKRRDLKMFYVVDFDVLDRLIVDSHVLDYLSKRYSNSMKEIYKSICKSTVISPSNVLNNLESTKIIIKDGITYVNDISNIGEYLKYLCNLGTIRKDFDGDEHYKKKLDRSLDLIKIKEMSQIINNKGARRLLNMFYEIGSLPDSEVGKKSLLPSSQVKHSIFILHKYGCVNLEYPSDSNEVGKHPSVWRFNSQEFTKVISKHLEKDITSSLVNINHAWETGNIFENEAFLIEISKLHWLSEKYFLFSKKF